MNMCICSLSDDIPGRISTGFNASHDEVIALEMDDFDEIEKRWAVHAGKTLPRESF